MERPRAVLLSQGDEVVTGQTVDTNAAWLAERLTDLGFDVVLKMAVGDRREALVEALQRCFAAGDVLVGTGGLGPTQDDLTSEAVARVLGCELALDQGSLDHITALYAAFGRTMAPSNEKQAWLPTAAAALRNDWGTAPGILAEHDGAIGFFVPGVPREMRSFWSHRIEPRLRERFSLSGERLRTLRCLGIHESRLASLLGDFTEVEGMVLGFRTKLPENQVKLRFAPTVDAAREQELVDAIRGRIGRSVFGIDSGPVEAVIGELLVDAGETVATAESCTGGGLSAALTSVPGASRYFLEGSCVYADEAKVRTCGVDPAILQAHGAVSEPVAIQLAQGIRERAGSTYGLGTTGIAGPGGGTAEKPVGTVHIAVATPSGVHHRALRLAGSRERIVQLTVGSALDLFRRHLQGRTDFVRLTP